MIGGRSGSTSVLSGAALGRPGEWRRSPVRLVGSAPPASLLHLVPTPKPRRPPAGLQRACKGSARVAQAAFPALPAPEAHPDARCQFRHVPPCSGRARACVAPAPRRVLPVAPHSSRGPVDAASSSEGQRRRADSSGLSSSSWPSSRWLWWRCRRWVSGPSARPRLSPSIGSPRSCRIRRHSKTCPSRSRRPCGIAAARSSSASSRRSSDAS